ncbi:MAG: OmpA family protein [Myxococcales bacterium]|nr:OmpA family protein [Myxococcales bacterium]
MRLAPASVAAALVVGAAVGVLPGPGAGPAPAHADPASGVDAALFRPSYDGSGVLSLEGARLPTRYDLSWKLLLGFAKGPLDVVVPGIGNGDDVDNVLNYTLTLDMAFGFTVTKKLAVGLGAAVYRTDPGPGYGARGRFVSGQGGVSTGLISLRELSNQDPSGNYEAQSLSGPLDVRVGAKYQFLDGPRLAATAIGTVVLPFGEDEMFLGDRNLVFEPRLALDYRFDRLTSTKLVANLGARIRERTVLQAFDNRVAMDMMLPGAQVAQAVLDVRSEALIGVGGLYEVSPSVVLAAEAVGLIPLPEGLSYGDCRLADGRRCSSLTDAEQASGAGGGDLAAYAAGGVSYRMNPHLTATLAGSAGLVGARADDFRAMVGVTWSPQPESEARVGRGDRDGDGIPDLSDACPDDPEDRDGYQDDDGCPDLDNDGDGVLDVDDKCPDEPEDRDAFQDEDGCPERDNDGDGIPDVADRCPNDAEDIDGFEDDDGCPDEDNDGDGFPDSVDKCPNDPETVNGVDDDDGCPDVRTTTGPVEASDRIDLRGNRIEFAAGTANLTPASRLILDQVAQLMRDRGFSVRIEVHVARGTRSRVPRVIAAQKRTDKALSQRRADAVFQYLQQKGVPAPQMTGSVGLGSDRPLVAPTDAANDRVDFIKTQQRTP